MIVPSSAFFRSQTKGQRLKTECLGQMPTRLRGRRLQRLPVSTRKKLPFLLYAKKTWISCCMFVYTLEVWLIWIIFVVLKGIILASLLAVDLTLIVKSVVKELFADVSVDTGVLLTQGRHLWLFIRCFFLIFIKSEKIIGLVVVPILVPLMVFATLMLSVLMTMVSQDVLVLLDMLVTATMSVSEVCFKIKYTLTY